MGSEIAAMSTSRAQLQHDPPAVLYGWLRPMPSSRMYDAVIVPDGSGRRARRRIPWPEVATKRFIATTSRCVIQTFRVS